MFIYWPQLFITCYLNMALQSKEQWTVHFFNLNIPHDISEQYATIFYTNRMTLQLLSYTNYVLKFLVKLKLSFIMPSPPILTPKPVVLQTLHMLHQTTLANMTQPQFCKFWTNWTVFNESLTYQRTNYKPSSTMLVMILSKTSLSTMSLTSLLWPKTIFYIHWKT